VGPHRCPQGHRVGHHAAGGTGTLATRAQTTFQRALRQNPLGVGAAAVALGAVAGLALPSTQKEQQLLGEARETVMERAADAVEQTAARVEEAVVSAS
jgi:hypothetical protein